jgi:hypothetical protein
MSNLKSFSSPVHFDTMKAVLIWATRAAKEHVDLCLHLGKTPDPETNMGLWQSFQDTFPKGTLPGNYDLYVTLYSETYSNTVKALTS